MKNVFAKTALFLIPLVLLGCNGGQKTTKNFFDTNVKVIARDGAARVSLSDPRYNYQYSIEFIKDKLFDNISLGGGLAGKTIGDAIAVSEDLHTITISLSGKVNDMSATEGTITIGPGAIKALNSEYEGFTFINTFTLGAETEYKSSF